ncbi:MAG TPA: CPBP family glutamic-type intramembrane protease [Candidatus Binataceae bacterium]|nr:CPBP family glutamic-type intramembrane protease [Candidatus Binataceae bacterium]
MADEGDSRQYRLAKLALLIGLAIAGQFIARLIATWYVNGVSAPAQHASIATDWLLLVCVPFGLFTAPTLSISSTPLLDRLMRREPIAHQFNRALFHSLVLVVISLAAGLALLMLPHPHSQAPTTTLDAPVPLPFAMLLALAAPLREEIEFRLGLLTALGWIIYRMTRRRPLSLAIANVGQALLFGAIHQLAGFTGRTSALSLIGIVLEPRTIGGLIGGYAYFSYGLEVAVMTHAIYDATISITVALLSHP